MPNDIQQCTALNRGNLPFDAGFIKPNRYVPFRGEALKFGASSFGTMSGNILWSKEENSTASHCCPNYRNKGFLFLFKQVIFHVMGDAVHGSENAVKRPVNPDRNVSLHELRPSRSIHSRDNQPESQSGATVRAVSHPSPRPSYPPGPPAP